MPYIIKSLTFNKIGPDLYITSVKKKLLTFSIKLGPRYRAKRFINKLDAMIVINNLLGKYQLIKVEG